MNTVFATLVLTFGVTPPPSPPPLATPAPSLSPSASPSPAPSQAPLIASPAVLNLHPSQTQVVSISNARGALTARSDTPLVGIAVDQAAGTVSVTATTQTGQAVLTISDAARAIVTLPVRVAYDAGTVPQSLTLRATGNPIDAAWLGSQIEKAVAQAVQLAPGAALQLGSYTLPSTFAPGSSAAIPVPVHISGGTTYYDVDVNASVNLQDVDLPAFSPQLLYYDDDPEKIMADGVLYRNEVSPATPARLYYYHQNAGDSRRLLVVLRASQTPATVQIVDASAGPNADVMSVGHGVSRSFLLQKARNESVVLQLTPSAYVEDEFLMHHLDGAAGSIGFNVLTGGPVQVIVVSVPANVSDSQVGAYLDAQPLPGDGHHRTGAFRLDPQYATETLAYAAGGPDAQTQYGATSPQAADDSSGHDYGDYGIIRTLTFQLTNPTARPATAYLYERPMGGVVRSSFLVDGTLYQPGCARLPNRYQIGPPLNLQGQSRSQLVVQTMTDGGSNYPIEVGVSATQPQPTTPPISAPDGCFPKGAPAAAPSPSPSPAAEPTGRMSIPRVALKAL